MKAAVILGTRPEIIKMAPVMEALDSEGASVIVVHTGQHYQYQMDQIFFDELSLPKATFNLEVGSQSHAVQTGEMLKGIEAVLVEEKPDAVLVQGDTNSVLAGALAAAKIHQPVGHVEAGLRSFDKRMPEELNRILTDHVSTFLFAPTPVAQRNLLNENIDSAQIYVTGNTIVDALNKHIPIAEERGDALSRLGVERGRYCLATIHRPENTDDEERFANILEGFSRAKEELAVPVIYPVHPRALKIMADLPSHHLRGVTVIEPLGYHDFLHLQANAGIIVTDSGGVQEEACILRVPCVTVRNNTERPETLEIGSNVLCPAEPKAMVEAVLDMIDKQREWSHPFGDGTAGRAIAQILLEAFS